MPSTLTLTIDASASAEDVLADVRSLDGIAAAKLLNPTAKKAVGRSMAFAEVDDRHDVEQLRQQVARVPGVKSCSIPPLRYAV